MFCGDDHLQTTGIDQARRVGDLSGFRHRAILRQGVVSESLQSQDEEPSIPWHGRQSLVIDGPARAVVPHANLLIVVNSSPILGRKQKSSRLVIGRGVVNGEPIPVGCSGNGFKYLVIDQHVELCPVGHGSKVLVVNRPAGAGVVDTDGMIIVGAGTSIGLGHDQPRIGIIVQTRVVEGSSMPCGIGTTGSVDKGMVSRFSGQHIKPSIDCHRASILIKDRPPSCGVPNANRFIVIRPIATVVGGDKKQDIGIPIGCGVV